MDTRVDLHPMSPLGLTRTGRACLSSIVEPGLHVGRRVLRPHLARGLIPIPNTPPRRQRGSLPINALLKERRQTQPLQPHTDLPPTPLRNRLMLALAYDAGLRREELCL